MDSDELRKWFREHRELRLGPAMGEYVLNRVRTAKASGDDVAIMGADARTGRPVLTTVSADVIRAAFSGPLPTAPYGNTLSRLRCRKRD